MASKKTLFSIEYRFDTDFRPIRTTISAYSSPFNPSFRPPKRNGRDLIHQKYGFSSHRCSKGNFSLSMPKFNFIQLSVRKSNCGNVKIKKEFRPNSILAICNSKSPRPMVGRESAKSIRWSLDRKA